MGFGCGRVAGRRWICGIAQVLGAFWGVGLGVWVACGERCEAMVGVV